MHAKFANFIALLALILIEPTAAHAVEAAATPTPAAAASDSAVIPEISVLGDQNKTSTYDFAPTVSELSGEKLDQRRSSTLGETLSQELGVSSTFFGPNSSRPIIRGLGGERIRVLQNGMGVLDASAASEDHAVAIDPLAIDRIEVVRGPAALVYGPSAIGGVVNAITNRIPESFQKGFTGKAETRYTTVDRGTSGALGVDYGAFDKWAIHGDFASRKSYDYDIPGFARTQALRTEQPLDPGEEEANGRVPNSGNQSLNGALGTSLVFGNGFVGASVSRYETDYGPVAERDIRIDMGQTRYDLSTAFKTTGFLQSIRFKNTFSDYQHQELEGADVGTTFKNRGNEARLELKHQSLGPVAGTFGLQANTFKFEALGEEAFLPSTENRILSAFIYEEASLAAFTPSFGLRVDQAQVESETTANFGAGQIRDFTGGSALAGVIYALTPKHSFALNLGYTERAPNYQELFANGAHIASGIFEVGDEAVEKEKAKSVEVSYRHKGERTQGSFGVFLQNFDNFIALSPTGVVQTVDGEDFPEYAYNGIRARLYGAEAEIRHQLPTLIPGGVVEIELKADLVKGKNRGSGDPLPRITPMRETLGLSYKADRYALDTSVQHVNEQTDTAPNETSTPSYVLWNMGGNYLFDLNRVAFSIFGRVNNILDEEARSHVSVLKDIAPLPGRNFQVGLQAFF